MPRGWRFGWGLLGVLALVCGLLVGAPGRGEAAALFTGVKQAAAGLGHTCAVRTDGTVWCWGANYYGQLGDGKYRSTVGLVQVLNLTGVTQIAAGAEHTCAVKSNGTVWCWGTDQDGELGDGGSGQPERRTPARVAGLSGVSGVSAESSKTCVVRRVGTVWCWGRLDDEAVSFVPVRIAGLSTAVQVTSGGGFDCARLSDGTVRCWGQNYSGQVGDGTLTYRSSPVAVLGLPGAVTQVDAGFNHTCARRDDGAAWCWGSNSDGRLGDGTMVDRLTATKSLMTGAMSVTAGDYHTCARTKVNRAKCWGGNSYGQLGNGTTVTRPTPVAVVGLVGVRSVTAGLVHTCAVLADSTMRCWGANESGQLGNGTRTDSAFPTPVLR